MGNLLCCAAPSGSARPRVHGRFNTDTAQGRLTKDGMYLEVTHAEWAANHPCEDRHLVHFLNEPSQSSVLVGVFDGIGGPEAAQLCQVRQGPLHLRVKGPPVRTLSSISRAPGH